MGGERLPRAAAGYNALGTVSDKGSRTIFEDLLGHLLCSYRAFVEDVQIVYPTPLSFLRPEAYTHGAGRTHVLHLARFR